MHRVMARLYPFLRLGAGSRRLCVLATKVTQRRTSLKRYFSSMVCVQSLLNKMDHTATVQEDFAQHGRGEARGAEEKLKEEDEGTFAWLTRTCTEKVHVKQAGSEEVNGYYLPTDDPWLFRKVGSTMSLHWRDRWRTAHGVVPARAGKTHAVTDTCMRRSVCLTYLRLDGRLCSVTDTCMRRSVCLTYIGYVPT